MPLNESCLVQRQCGVLASSASLSYGIDLGSYFSYACSVYFAYEHFDGLESIKIGYRGACVLSGKICLNFAKKFLLLEIPINDTCISRGCRAPIETVANSLEETSI